MILKVYGERLETADLTGGIRVSQEVKFDQNCILRVARVGIIHYNSNFDYLKLRCYSTRNSAPSKLLFESTNQRARTDIFTENYGVKETWFEFNYERMRQDEPYRFVLWANSYTGSDSNHLSWLKDWPKPINNSVISVNAYSMFRQEFSISFITSPL